MEGRITTPPTTSGVMCIHEGRARYTKLCKKKTVAVEKRRGQMIVLLHVSFICRAFSILCAVPCA
jgi:hypothetical protein